MVNVAERSTKLAGTNSGTVSNIRPIAAIYCWSKSGGVDILCAESSVVTKASRRVGIWFKFVPGRNSEGPQNKHITCTQRCAGYVMSAGLCDDVRHVSPEIQQMRPQPSMHNPNPCYPAMFPGATTAFPQTKVAAPCTGSS